VSCGRRHQTPCSEVLEQVYIYLDGEVGPEEYGKIREHLDECEPCLRQYGLDQAVKALVARSCGCDHAPEALRARVLARIREVRIEITEREFRTP
jgi:mycothiol system anti-sigma-R factor